MENPPSGRHSTTDGAAHPEPGARIAADPRGRPKQRRWLAAIGMAVGGVLLAGCQVPTFGIHPAVSQQGSDSVKLWQGFFIAGCIVFLFVFALIVWAALRYRRRSDQIPRQTQYRVVWEIAYTVLPVIIVLILFGFTFVTENSVDALPAPNLNVTVTGFQWGWRFTYPTQHVTVIGVELQDPEMVLPEHTTVRVSLKSHDVIHGFYVPALEFSRYAQPGVTNQFTLNLDKLGTYRGQCTQFCGLYHSLMRFRLKVVTPQQFAVWVKSHQSTSHTSISTAQHHERGSSAASTGTTTSHATSSTAYTGSTGT